MPLAMVAQLLLALWLFPDYLLAGRQFGKFFYGQFGGPAINHCQGIPFAIRRVNAQIERGGPKTAYVLHSCDRVFEQDSKFGPVVPRGTIAKYPHVRPGAEHFVIIPTIYEYDANGEKEHVAFMSRRERVVENCRTVGKPHPDFELWQCPGTAR
jgi:hypothetical protein